MEEFEVVFTNIDVEDIQNKLKKIGAEYIGEFFYKNNIFDFPGFLLNKDYSWVRLRDDGKKVNLSYKKRICNPCGGDDLGMKEIEFGVSDFISTKNFLYSIGMIDKLYQEKKRIRWKFKDVIFDIDFWPNLPPYLEVESTSYQKIDEIIDFIGLDISKKRIINNWEIYLENGIDLMKYKIVSFEKMVLKDENFEN